MIKNKGFVMVYPAVVQESEYCGTSIFVSYLIGKAIQFFGDQSEKFFISERTEQMKETGLTKKRIEKAEKEAIEKGWIQKQKTKTCPSRNQVLVCFSQIESVGSIENLKTLHCGAHINPHVGAHINPHVGAHDLYIDKDIDKEIDKNIADASNFFQEPPFSKPAPKQSNSELDDRFEEFLTIANLDDYSYSQQQICRTLFLCQLQADLRKSNLTIEDFLSCAKTYYVDKRPDDPKFIIRPHNFISKKQAGTNEPINPWKDWIGKSAPVKKEITMEEARQKILSGEW